MIRVFATREGLEGGKTSSGYVIERNSKVPFVALPSFKALNKFVRIQYKDKRVLAIVLDVGPWNEHDDEYVFNGDRPDSEHGEHVKYVNGKPTQVIEPEKVNKAGIDLGEYIWHQLGLKDNDFVEWEFVEP